MNDCTYALFPSKTQAHSQWILKAKGTKKIIKEKLIIFQERKIAVLPVCHLDIN